MCNVISDEIPTVISDRPSYDDAYAFCSNDADKTRWVFARMHRNWIRTRAAEAQNWRCCWCTRKMTTTPGRQHSLTAEHIVPKSQGGEYDYDNIFAACKRCNIKRGVLSIEEFMEVVIKHGWHLTH